MLVPDHGDSGVPPWPSGVTPLHPIWPHFDPRGHPAVVGAAARLQRQATVGPELALAAKTKRCLHVGDQQGRTNRTYKGNAGQKGRCCMIAAFQD